MEKKKANSIIKLLGKDNLSDSDTLRRKIFIYSVAEVALIVLLFAFSFFLFRIIVG